MSAVPTPIMADGQVDDRVRCETCRHCDERRNFCRELKMKTGGDLPVLCLRYQPRRHVVDQRDGKERWPSLHADILEARELNRVLK